MVLETDWINSIPNLFRLRTVHWAVGDKEGRDKRQGRSCGGWLCYVLSGDRGDIIDQPSSGHTHIRHGNSPTYFTQKWYVSGWEDEAGGEASTVLLSNFFPNIWLKTFDWYWERSSGGHSLAAPSLDCGWRSTWPLKHSLKYLGSFRFLTILSLSWQLRLR